MPDWKVIVRRRLHLPGLSPAREAEIVEDVAMQLEEAYQTSLRRDAAPAEAEKESLAEIPDWPQFAIEIQQAERRNARPKFDRSLERFDENTRNRGGRGSMLADLLSDMRYGLRMLRNNPGFTAVAVITLALGIGLNTAIFSLVNAVLFKPLPVRQPEQLVGIYNTVHEGPITHVPIAYPDFRDFAEQSRSFEGMIAYALIPLALDKGNESETAMAEIVTGDYFSLLGVNMTLGRGFLPEEDRTPGTHAVVVLSHTTWQQRFGADPAIASRVIRLNGNAFTVIGVAGPEFHGMFRGISVDAWVPMMMAATLHPDVAVNAGGPADADRLHDRRSQWMWSMGRLKPGVTLAQAQAEMQTIAGRLEKEFPATNQGRAVGLLPANDVKLFPGVDKILYATSFVLMAVVALVLLIAAANVANMLLVRAMARRKEIAVRMSLGASRWRLVRQLLTESLLLSVAGGALGLLLARWSNAALNAFEIPFPIHLALGLTLDVRVFAFTLAAATITSVAFGLAPALQASKTDVVSALKEESRTCSGGSGRKRMRNVLVVAQVALSLLLLIAAGLSIRSMMNARRVDPGFDARGVLVLETDPGLSGYTRQQGENFYRQLLDRTRRLPGVEAAGLATNLPLTFAIRISSAVPDGQQSLPPEQWTDLDNTSIGPGYFETLHIPILRGRQFSDQDSADAPLRGIINESLAQRFWPGLDPIGRRVIVGRTEPKQFEVIGVARNGKYRTLGEEPRPFLYTALSQRYENGQDLLVRASGNPRAILPSLRQQVREMDERIPVSRLDTLEEEISVSLLIPRAGAALFGLFGLLGLVLASVGLYGVIAYTVSLRTREIGIRVAMGAQRRDILRLVVGEGMLLTGVGVTIGLAGAFALTRVLAVMLYGISANDPLTFIGISALLLSVTLIACLLPARRATEVDPMAALRYE